VITFTVYGTAQPKGSARAFIPKGWTRPVITSATKGLKGWEQTIRGVAQFKSNGEMFLGPMTLHITFCLPRPKSLKKSVPHIKRPDLDKLIRGATDALTGIIWKDDAQLVSIIAEKLYAPTAEDAPRAHFVIERVGEGQTILLPKPTEEF
jgi:Holliday junction resolvase RusA-like endonuclease